MTKPNVPYMKFYPKDYLGDTTTLTLEEHGAYLLILFLMWGNGGYLKFNQKDLARHLGVSVPKFNKIWFKICVYFHQEKDEISNNKMQQLYAKTAELVEGNKAKAEAAARARWDKNR